MRGGNRSSTNVFMLMLIVRHCDRQLQHRGSLARYQPVDLQNLSIWEFQRIVLNVRIVHIDLPEASDPVIHTALAKARAQEAKTEGAVVLDVIVKREFRSGQQADCHLGWTVMDD